MRHRIHVSDGLAPDSDLVVKGDEFHHASRVVRVREGESVEVFDGRGAAFSGEITGIGRDELRIRTAGAVPSRESPLSLTLAMAVIQLEKFELVLQKATELGVSRLIPLVTERVEVRPERYRGKGERWEKIILEAVKQSGRSTIPDLDPASRFDDVVARPGLKMLFDADADAGEQPETIAEVTLLVGPEGGWSERELALAREQHCLFSRLGPRRLRAETAAIAATGIITARYGDI